MDGALFDRLARTLVKLSERRNALKAVAGIGVAAIAGKRGLDDASAKKKHKHKKKKRCRKRTQTCGGKRKCCKGSGLISCDLVTEPVECADLAQEVCCGQDGASCNPELNGCDCCGELFCVQYETESLCRSEAT